MNLSIPPAVLTANQSVVGSLKQANVLTRVAQQNLEDSPRMTGGTAKVVTSALESARQALEGIEALGAGNLLDGTFQRYAGHSVRDLEKAAAMLGRSGSLGTDGLAILTKTLFDAEVATRLGTDAGKRSLANPSPRAIERATDFVGGGEGSNGGPVWVDGEWLDELGNPVRGGGSGYTGPDGDSFGWDGEPVRGGVDEYVGPDGTGYSGI